VKECEDGNTEPKYPSSHLELEIFSKREGREVGKAGEDRRVKSGILGWRHGTEVSIFVGREKEVFEEQVCVLGGGALMETRSRSNHLHKKRKGKRRGSIRERVQDRGIPTADGGRVAVVEKSAWMKTRGRSRHPHGKIRKER
jgi:hypothetical protein